MNLTSLIKANILFLMVIVSWPVLNVHAQSEVRVEYSNRTFQLDQVFKITVSTENEKLKSISNFPEIEDFIKGKTFFIKGKKNYVVEQEYLPLKTGVFSIQAFNLMVNGKRFSFKEKTLHVLPSKFKSPRKKLIDEPTDKNQPENKPDAFLSVVSDKSVVYTGEGFNITATFYIAKNNTVEYNFVDIKAQVSRMIDKLKPAHCWIEESGLAPLASVDSALIDNKSYLAYIIYSANFYPFDTTAIKIPSFDFKIINYKVSRTTLSVERQAFYHKLSSFAYSIKVLALPPNPSEGRVAVGDFTFEEKLSVRKTRMGEMFKYYFTIKNKNGLSTTVPPILVEHNEVEIFTPRISIKKYKEKNEVLNGKTYEYPIISRTPGKLGLKDYFYWIYFNVHFKKYDTLLPKLTVEIQKVSQEEEVQLTVHQNFYEQMISKVSNNPRSKEKEDKIKLISNILIVFMLISTFILILKK